jgi:hypothetical protein
MTFDCSYVPCVLMTSRLAAIWRSDGTTRAVLYGLAEVWGMGRVLNKLRF